MRYDIDNERYSFVASQNEESVVRTIAASKDKLYLFEGKKIFEMNVR